MCTKCKTAILALLTILILLFCPILLNFILRQYTPWNIKIIGTEIDWLNFWGTYIGAIIGASITLLAMYRESKRNALNIMINNQENYIKELKQQLENRVGGFSFLPIGNFEIHLSRNNRNIDKKQIDDIIKTLNDYYDRVLTQFNAWGVIYSSEDVAMKKFNDTYVRCVNTYQDVVLTMINQLEKLKLNGNIDDFNDWLNRFRDNLKQHQEDKTYDMFDATHEWLKIEKEKLDTMRKQLKSFFPKIED